MSEPILLYEKDSRGVARVILNKPQIHNAFDDQLIIELHELLGSIARDDTVRVVTLAANGKSFSAGADLNWMKRMADYSESENVKDAEGLAALMRCLNEMPQPTIAAVRGACYGGGVGLVACCDIALATPAATFALSEVRLGLIPSVISPYVVAAMGPRAARRYFLTAERFSAAQAQQCGLLHAVFEEGDFDAGLEQVLDALLDGGPSAQAAAKELVFAVSGRPIDDALVRDTAERIAGIRASQEGREGVAAFLEKRRARWIK